MVGRPMPRLWYWPSAMSCAARHAIWRRVSGFIGSLLAPPSYGHHAIDENSRRRDRLGIKRAQLNDLAHLRDGDLPRHRHHRVEVARGFAINEIAPAIAALRLDEREIARERLFEDIELALDRTCFFALRQQRLGAGTG